MNQLKGVIQAIESEQDISLVRIIAAGDFFSALVIDTPETASYLQSGKEIIMLFKETEMSIGKNLTGGLSLRNRFNATISNIEAGKVLSSVYLNFKSYPLCAIITTASVTELKLAVGDTVVGLVKTNEVSLMEATA